MNILRIFDWVIIIFNVEMIFRLLHRVSKVLDIKKLSLVFNSKFMWSLSFTWFVFSNGKLYLQFQSFLKIFYIQFVTSYYLWDTEISKSVNCLVIFFIPSVSHYKILDGSCPKFAPLLILFKTKYCMCFLLLLSEIITATSRNK